MKVVNKLKSQLLYLTLAIFTLIPGIWIYLCVNQNNYLYSFIGDIFSIKPINSDGFLMKIIICFGADYLWSMSYTFIVQALFVLQQKSVWKLLFCSLAGVVVELLQQFKVIGGTPDVFDVITYFIGSLTVVIVLYCMRRRTNEQEN